MGRRCRICGRDRPNEQFGGRGERAVVCRKCRRQPREQRKRVFLTDEILGFLEQSNISAKNLRRLEQLQTEAPEDIAVLAALVRQIAQVRPRKRKRWNCLRQQHADLYRMAAEAGLHYGFAPEPLGERYDDAFDDEELDLNGWISPRPWETEPTAEDVYGASGGWDFAEAEFADSLWIGNPSDSATNHLNLLGDRIQVPTPASEYREREIR